MHVRDPMDKGFAIRQGHPMLKQCQLSGKGERAVFGDSACFIVKRLN